MNIKRQHGQLNMVYWSLLVWLHVSIYSLAATAEDLPVYRLTLKDHLFYPSRLEVPAYVKFKLVIHNQDDTAEEFDSFDLNREKVIFAHRESTIFVGPLKPGEYSFFGEYNSSTAQGVLIAISQEQEAKGAN